MSYPEASIIFLFPAVLLLFSRQMYKKCLLLLLHALLLSGSTVAQDKPEHSSVSFVLNPEIMYGYTVAANEDFPDRDLQFQLLANFGWDQHNNTSEWANRLKAPRTGLSLAYGNYGNARELGSSITLMPYLEFGAFGSKRFKILTGMGGTYFTTIYDPVENPNNQAITTRLVWSFRSFLNYRIASGKRLDWRVGVGYFHHSNGHTRLPNQGLNSFLLSLSADLKPKEQHIKPRLNQPTFADSQQDYLSFRTGLGVNVLGKPDPFNDKKGVYTVAAEYGRIYNKVWKLGLGVFYRYYQHYFDYIDGNESLVQVGREFADLRDNPSWNASALGIYASGEVLLNHIGIEVELGVNIHKPAYQIDWRINQGWSFIPREIPPDNNFVLGAFNSKYKIKHIMASRMGLKYYLFGTDRQLRHNVFVGAHINANGGQADFTDLSLGYVYRFEKKSK